MRRRQGGNVKMEDTSSSNNCVPFPSSTSTTKTNAPIRLGRQKDKKKKHKPAASFDSSVGLISTIGVNRIES